MYALGPCRHTGCLRKDQSGCYPPDHKFYDVTHQGVDAMATRFVLESQLLMADENMYLNLQNPRLEYLWQIGRFDFYDGMAKADHVSSCSISAKQLKSISLYNFY